MPHPALESAGRLRVGSPSAGLAGAPYIIIAACPVVTLMAAYEVLPRAQAIPTIRLVAGCAACALLVSALVRGGAARLVGRRVRRNELAPIAPSLTLSLLVILPITFALGCGVAVLDGGMHGSFASAVLAGGLTASLAAALIGTQAALAAALRDTVLGLTWVGIAIAAGTAVAGGRLAGSAGLLTGLCAGLMATTAGVWGRLLGGCRNSLTPLSSAGFRALLFEPGSALLSVLLSALWLGPWLAGESLGRLGPEPLLGWLAPAAAIPVLLVYDMVSRPRIRAGFAALLARLEGEAGLRDIEAAEQQLRHATVTETRRLFGAGAVVVAVSALASVTFLPPAAATHLAALSIGAALAATLFPQVALLAHLDRAPGAAYALLPSAACALLTLAPLPFPARAALLALGPTVSLFCLNLEVRRERSLSSSLLLRDLQELHREPPLRKLPSMPS
ncbi:MAG: hypothetical protein ACYTFT_02825 [Planctomycetota bacterium]|jgi:hypothetical protein